MDDDRTLAKIIWEYMLLHMPLEKADVIIVLGSIDQRVAEYAAELYQRGYASRVLFSGTSSGHRGDLLASDYGNKTESEYFAEVAEQNGVPKKVMLIENQSTDTGKNAVLSFRKLQEENIPAQIIIVVTKPYMERRVYATFKKQWPDNKTRLMVTSPQILFEKYFSTDQPFEKVVNLMIGDLERISKYPQLGFQIPQIIPDKVHRAAQALIAHGYKKHLIKN
ncbi:MAG TPA: YdcF family protein [Candidatus Paceibacterota bacterium]